MECPFHSNIALLNPYLLQLWSIFEQVRLLVAESYVFYPVTMFSASGFRPSYLRACIRPHRTPHVSLRVEVLRMRSYGVFWATE